MKVGRPKKSPKEKLVTFSSQLKISHLEQMKDLANRDGITFSRAVRRAVIKYINIRRKDREKKPELALEFDS